MRWKLLLPALAACAMLAVSAPSSFATSANVNQNKRIATVNGAIKGLKKAIGILQNVNAGQTSAIGEVDAKIVATQKTVQAIIDNVPTILNGLTALKAGLEAAGAGLTALSAAVQGPSIAGQLGAAGTSAPGAANTATPAALPTGTVYRQIVLAVGGAGAGAPIGARTWLKLPELSATGYTNNSWVCTSSAGTGVFGGGYDGQAACPSGFVS